MVGKRGIGYILIELSLDYIEEEETTIAIVLLFILGFVGVILLIKVVLWRVGVLLSSDPR
jgi:succinate dehydrogenase hydrophobic anchor subunit